MDFATLAKRVGKNLRRARWRQGWTQQDVAAKGITYRYLQELERGQRNPSLSMLHELAGILRVRVADLLEVGEPGERVDLARVDESRAPKPGRRKRPVHRRT